MSANTASTLSTFEGIKLVAGREMTVSLRSKAFIWSTIVTLVIVALVILGQSFIGNLFSGSSDDEPQTVAVLDDAAASAASEFGVDTVVASSIDDARAKLEAGEVKALYVPLSAAAQLGATDELGQQAQASSDQLVLIGNDETPSSLQSQMTVQPEIFQLHRDSDVSPLISYFFALALAIVFMGAVMTFANRIAQTIVEEKSSRVVELLLATLRPTVIFAGKLVGGTILALLQIASIVVVAVVCLAITGQLGDIGNIGVAGAWFVPLFILGFLLYAAMYAAIAATVTQAEDVNTALSPLIFLAMAPYVLVIVGSTNPVMMSWLSFIPFTSPIAMPVRLFSGVAAWWEPLVALAILIVSVIAVVILGARIYENSILRIGKRVKLRDALKSA